MIRVLGFAIMFILVSAMIQFAISTTSASNSLNILSPTDKPYGLSYSEHIKNFWKWMISIPATGHPFEDKTGEKCSTNQMNTNNSVFYLPPSSGGDYLDRVCKVPVGKALLIPIHPMEMAEPELQGSPTIEDLSKSAKHDVDIVSDLLLKIDNTEYKKVNLDPYRTHTDAFEVTFPKDGIFGVTVPGTYKSVADGIYIVTEPLSKGNHTIEFSSEQIETPDSPPVYVQHVIYKIIAE